MILSDYERMERKKVDREKWIELKKYAPFLEYITKKDPVRHEKYSHLLDWLKMNQEFPLRMSNMCEQTIRSRYEKLKSSMDFPPHISGIFTETDAIVISDDDEDDTPPAAPRRVSDSNESETGSATTSKGEKGGQEDKIKNCLILLKNSRLKSTSPNRSKGENSISPKQNKDQNGVKSSLQNNCTPSPKTTPEDGEIISDGEDVVIITNNTEESSNSRSNLEIGESRIEKAPKASEVSVTETDDDITDELLKRIDSFSKEKDRDRHRVLTAKDLDKEDDQSKIVPILKPKNLGGERQQNSDFLSPISDEDEPGRVHRKKKKKKRRHKKKSSDWYISEVENQTKKSDNDNVLKQKILRKDCSSTDDISKNKKKNKKLLKSGTEKRPLYVSDDEEVENSTEALPSPAQVDVVVKTPESELFHRRDPGRKHNETIVFSTSSDRSTGVLLGPGDEKSKKAQPDQNQQHSSSTSSSLISLISDESLANIMEALSQTNPMSPIKKTNDTNLSKSAQTPSSQQKPSTFTSSSLSSVLEASRKDEMPSPKKQMPLNKNELRDLNSMGLDELNDIYDKLCQSTGIPLEDLLNDLVTKSAKNEVLLPPTNGDQEEYQQQNDVGAQVPPNNDSNSLDFYQSDSNNYVSHQQMQQMQVEPMELPATQQFQRQQQFQHQQQQYQQQTYQQQQQFQQQQHSLLVQCLPNNVSPAYPFHPNTLRPGLNLNDPRIVQKLKQIKDSPIHNDNIRESANYLINHCARPHHTKSNSVTEVVTSKTAKTYGEHKRLRELEKQKELERQKTEQSKTEKKQINRTNSIPNDDSSRINPSKKVTTKPKQKKSSESNSGRKTPKISEKPNECVEEPKTVMSFSLNKEARRRIEASPSPERDQSSSGRMTPFERERVVDIVLSAIGQTKESTETTLKDLTKSPSRVPRSSTRKSRSVSPQAKKDATETAQNVNSAEKNTKNKGDSKVSNTTNNSYEESKPKTKRRHSGSQSKDTQSKRRAQSSTKTKHSTSNRGCRELTNLNCTFLDYREMFEKNWLPTINGKRRCSVAAPRAKLDNSSDSDESDDRDDSSRRQKVTAAPISRRRQTCSALQMRPLSPEKSTLKVVFRRLSESGTFGVETVDKNNSSDDTDEFNIEEHRQAKLIKAPIETNLKVKLKKLSFDEIKKSIHRDGKDGMSQNKNSASSTESQTSKTITLRSCPAEKDYPRTSTDFNETPILVPFTSEPVNSSIKVAPKVPKHSNVDLKSTLTSTKVCAICNKRPVDLTNHYVAQHKTESYVSRLTSAEVDELEANITFAVPCRKRYKVTCVFCQDELEDHFVNFHAHYSYHTGEYGFKCDVCELMKPYREDIRSHQHRASRCRNSKIRTNYLYSPDLKVIYLYVCRLCNFVQLNEANIHKHHRDHHGFKFDEPQQVRRCIIAAIDNGEVINEVLPANLENEVFINDPIVNEGNLIDQKQEFLHEFPLDIKDVVPNSESQAKPIVEIKSTEGNQFAQENEEAQKNNSIAQKDMVEIKEEIPVKVAPTPEALLGALYGGECSNKIMTVIHCSSSGSSQGSHQPFAEPVDIKPDISEIKTEPQPSPENVSGSNQIVPEVRPPALDQRAPEVRGPELNQRVPTVRPPDLNQRAPEVRAPELNQRVSTVTPPDLNQRAPEVRAPELNQRVPTSRPPDLNQRALEVRAPELNQRAPTVRPPDLNQRAPEVRGPELNQRVPTVRPPDLNQRDPEVRAPELNQRVPIVRPPENRPRVVYRVIEKQNVYYGLYKCLINDCWFSTNQATRFVEHVEYHTSRRSNLYLNCAYCNVKNSCVEKLVRHVRSRHSRSRYQCSQCTYRSLIPGNVAVHRELDHRDSTAIKSILECAGRVRDLEEKFLATKNKMIENVSKLKCPECPSEYYAISSIKSHILKKHPLARGALESMQFFEFVCIYCKEESRSKNFMQIHLAVMHPDEMSYVVERKLKSDMFEDSIDNLHMVNIGASVPSEDIHAALFHDCEDLQPNDQDENEENMPTVGRNLVEHIFINPPLNREAGKEEQRLKSLLELYTENTGFDRTTLYRCAHCSASFFSYDLWLVHVKNRHNITEAILCPYCEKQIALPQAATHFETHGRHEHLCYHCVETFYSRDKLNEHFVLCHVDCPTFVDKSISVGLRSCYLAMKENETQPDWTPVLESFANRLTSKFIESMLENMDFVWWKGLTSSVLEEIYIPQYVKSESNAFKCLVRSCPFVGLDESELQCHLNEHTVPRHYQCSHCVENISELNWENIRNHEMLHKSKFHICCVCKYLHHDRSQITNHIETLHNSRDVPVVSLSRDEVGFKISLSIVLPPMKTSFGTFQSCFCCKRDVKGKKKLMHHLRSQHNITLCPKCVFCNKVLLTQAETEKHGEEHEMDYFKLKYDVLAASHLNLEVNSMSPFNIEVKIRREKRRCTETQTSPLKKVKLDDDADVTIKEEITIKKECDDEPGLEDKSGSDKPAGVLKCISIDQLVVKETTKPNDIPGDNVSKRPEHGKIFVKSAAELQKPVPPPNVCVSQYQQLQGLQSQVPKLATAACSNNQYNQKVIAAHLTNQFNQELGAQYPSNPHNQQTAAPCSSNQFNQQIAVTDSSNYLNQQNVALSSSNQFNQHAAAQCFNNQFNQQTAASGSSNQSNRQTAGQCFNNQFNEQHAAPFPSNQFYQPPAGQLSSNQYNKPPAAARPSNQFNQKPAGPPSSNQFNHQQTRVQYSNHAAQHPPQRQFLMNIQLPNNQCATVTSHSLPPYSIATTRPTTNPPEYSHQNGQPVAPAVVRPPFLPPAQMHSGINNSVYLLTEQHSLSESSLVDAQQEAENTRDPILPEITPICENCKMEFVDFTSLRAHFETAHAPQNHRFLYRLTRKVKCVHCSFKGSLSLLQAHQKTYHPGKPRLCSSLIDFRRCGLCHGIFNSLPSPDCSVVPTCWCPERQRVLVDCLNLNTMKLLLRFGKKTQAYLCTICSKVFHFSHECSQHLLSAHNRTDLSPKVWPIETLLFVCNLCKNTTTSVKENIEHIRRCHIMDPAEGTLADRMKHYYNIAVIYPRGLVLNVSDLKNIGVLNEEKFVRDVRSVEAQFNGTSI